MHKTRVIEKYRFFEQRIQFLLFSLYVQSFLSIQIIIYYYDERQNRN